MRYPWITPSMPDAQQTVVIMNKLYGVATLGNLAEFEWLARTSDNDYNRKREHVFVHTDEEWAAIEEANRPRYEEWFALTEKLIEDGVLEDVACYECGGTPTPPLRPRHWAYTETDEEFAERLKTLPPRDLFERFIQARYGR